MDGVALPRARSIRCSRNGVAVERAVEVMTLFTRSERSGGHGVAVGLGVEVVTLFTAHRRRGNRVAVDSAVHGVTLLGKGARKNNGKGGE